MKKILITLAAITCTVSAALAQKEIKYEKLYYKNATAENSEVSILIDNAVSTAGETKLKLKITNKTNDYIIYKPEESIFIINGKEMKPKEKWLILSPNESDFKVVNMKGENYNAVKNYAFTVAGLYKVTVGDKAITAPDFKLPPSKNDFKAGNFDCSLVKVYKETDATDAKFKCTYTGNNVGFIYPAKIAVKMPDGNDYANAKAKSKPVMLMKGEEDTFTLHWDKFNGGKAMDMQFVEMMIKWNDAFAEGTTEKMKSETIQLEFDQATSDAKAK
ncbi:MAG: hypothetical protein V4608_15290 [Bacteroidota bacterium]